jgi:hypothetical protein
MPNGKEVIEVLSRLVVPVALRPWRIAGVAVKHREQRLPPEQRVPFKIMGWDPTKIHPGHVSMSYDISEFWFGKRLFPGGRVYESLAPNKKEILLTVAKKKRVSLRQADGKDLPVDIPLYLYDAERPVSFAQDVEEYGKTAFEVTLPYGIDAAQVYMATRQMKGEFAKPPQGYYLMTGHGRLKALHCTNFLTQSLGWGMSSAFSPQILQEMQSADDPVLFKTVVEDLQIDFERIERMLPHDPSKAIAAAEDYKLLDMLGSEYNLACEGRNKIAKILNSGEIEGEAMGETFEVEMEDITPQEEASYQQELLEADAHLDILNAEFKKVWSRFPKD